MYVHQNIVSKIMKAPRFQGQVGLLTRENFANALGCYVLSKKSKMKAWKSHVQHSTFKPIWADSCQQKKFFYAIVLKVKGPQDFIITQVAYTSYLNCSA